MKWNHALTTLVATLAFFSLQLKAATISSLDAKINPGLSEIRVQVELDDINTEAVGSDPGTIWQGLKVRLHGYEVGQETAAESDKRYLWKSVALPEVQTSRGYTGTAVFTIAVFNNPAEPDEVRSIKSLYRKNNMRLELFLQFNNSEKTVVIERISGRPAEAPGNAHVTGGHRNLTIRWQGNTSVPYTGEGQKSVPGAVLVMLFNASDSNLDLNAARIDSDPGKGKEETASLITCKYHGSEKNCIQCPEAQGRPFTIATDQGKDSHSIFRLISNNKDGFDVVSDLEPGKYIVVMQYQDGVRRSACLEGNAQETISLMEANGENQGALKDVRCFIVTAAFGSPFHRLVTGFRWFRDTILMKTKRGRDVIELYYQKSPPYAELISKSVVLRSLTRGALFLPGLLFMAMKKAHEAPATASLTGLSLLLIALSGSLLIRCIRRGRNTRSL